MSRNTVRVLSLLLLVVVLAGGCRRGASDDPSNAADGPTVSGQPQGPRDPADGTPSPQELLAARPGNPNDLSNALGRLCWVLRESAATIGRLGRTVADPPVLDDDELRATIDEAKEFFELMDEGLGSADGLPDEAADMRAHWDSIATKAQGFADRLGAGTSREQRQEIIDEYTALVASVDPEASEAFIEAAEDDPDSCPSFGG